MNDSDISKILLNALTQKGLTPVLKAAYDILSLPIAVADSSFTMLAPNYPPTDQGFEIWDLPQHRKYVPLEIVSIFYLEDILPRVLSNPGKCIYVDWGKMEPTPCLTTAICYEGHIEGFIAAYCPREKLLDWHFDALPVIADAVGIALSKENLVRSSDNPLVETFLNRLFAGSVEPGEIQYWNNALRLSLSNDYAVLSLLVSPKHANSLKSFIEQQSISTGDRYLAAVNNDSLAILVYGLKDKTALDAICTQISEFVKPLDICCGISDIFTDPYDTPAYLHQAKLARDIGFKKNPNKNIHDFSDYRLPSIVAELGRIDDLKIYFNPALFKLKEYDLKYGSDFLNTLKTFLYNRCNMIVAAAALHIHRNTLLYRINRIEQEIGLCLNDTQTAIELYLSFLINDETNVL